MRFKPETAALMGEDSTGLFEAPRPSRPELFFAALHGHRVAYVALDGFGAVAGIAPILGRRPEGKGELKLTVERTFDNCTVLIAALTELEATILIDPHRKIPIARRSHPVSLLFGEHRFDTAAGRVFLRDPAMMLGCRTYEELRQDAVDGRLPSGLEIKVAGMRDLARIADPLSVPVERAGDRLVAVENRAA